MPAVQPSPRDPVHDPGVLVAKERAEGVPLREASIVNPSQSGAIRVGTASWTDPSLTAPGVFYPANATTAAARLRYYASRFPLVEVASTYYELPSRRTAALWVGRTPAEFTFDVKANALMTGQPSEVSRLPAPINQELPDALRTKQRIFGRELPAELYDAVWVSFRDALQPLQAAGKLGAVLLQYPRWFKPTRASAEALLEAKDRLPDYQLAIEFRHRGWLAGRLAQRTLAFLEEHGLAYLMVDEPQGTESSVPAVAAVTSKQLAILRLHGRRAETWDRPGATVAERYRYLYTPEELEEWVAKVLKAAQQTEAVHILFNNCHGNYGTTNALEFTLLLQNASQGAGAPPLHQW
jgi:uncharacterized protein YecE (DUF72 family)